MKVIGINGSIRKDGNTAILIRTIFEKLKKGIETELIQLTDVKINPCRITQRKDCLACMGNENCVFKDYDFHLIFRKIVAAG